MKTKVLLFFVFICGASTVLAQTLTCDTFSLNMFASTTPTLIATQFGGYVIGNNGYGDKAKAQQYHVTSPKQISEVAVWFGAKINTSGNAQSSIILNIYDMDGTGTSSTGTVAAPGTILSSFIPTSVFVTDIDTLNLMYITLPDPIVVTSDYAVGFDLTGLVSGDTVGIVCNMDGDAYVSEMTWEKDAADSWTTILASWNIDIDIAIFPIECDTNIDSTCSVNFILYPDTTLPHHWFAELSSTGSTIVDYIWDWGDGTTSSGPYPAHTYDSAGYYTICVYTTNTNNCIASYCDSSTYIYKTDAEMVSVSVIASQTGIEETAKNTFTLYPNPATNTLTLNTDLNLKNAQLTILNAQGQLVINSTFDVHLASGETTFDISNLNTGLYHLLLEDEQGRVVAKKFVVAR